MAVTAAARDVHVSIGFNLFFLQKKKTKPQTLLKLCCLLSPHCLLRALCFDALTVSL